MDEIMLAKEVAEEFKVDVQRVYEMCRTKSIPFILLGQRQYRFSRTALKIWLDKGGNQEKGEVTNDK